MKSIVMGFLVAIAVFMLWQYGLPAWDGIRKARLELSAIRNVATKAEEIKKKRDEVIVRYNAVTEDKKSRIDQLVPAALRQEDIFVFFNKAAGDASMALESVAVNAASSATDTRMGKATLSFEMKSSGSYNNFRALMTALETNTRLVDITAINITEDAKRVFTLTLKGNMYYANEIK